MAKFGNYAVRAIGHKDKARWVVEIAKTPAQAAHIAKRLARTKLGTYAPVVCVFNLKRWGERPVCYRATDTVGYQYYRGKPKINRIRYQPR